VAVGLTMVYLLVRRERPVYLLDFALALPPPEWKFPKQTFLKASSCNPVRPQAWAAAAAPAAAVIVVVCSLLSALSVDRPHRVAV